MTDFSGTSPTRRRIMRANRRKDTAPELAVRSALHRAGLRFRVDYPITSTGGGSVRPDIVFPRRRLAVFIDGCFWHSCPSHGSVPASNEAYWLPKLAENRTRDSRHNAELAAGGWLVLRFWEHEDVEDVAAVIVKTYRAAA